MQQRVGECVRLPEVRHLAQQPSQRVLGRQRRQRGNQVFYKNIKIKKL